MLIDTHCHLDFKELAEDRAGVLERAMEAGVDRMITIATNKSRWPSYLQIAAENPNIYCSIGVHPESVGEPDEDFTAADIIALVNANPKVVGIGECGLDYHYEDAATPAMQARYFDEHIAAAQETGLPVIIHARDADDDMAAQLHRRYREKSFTGLLHCFSSTQKLAEAALEIGFYVSFSGIVTFKNAKSIQDTARIVPVEKMLVETDAPFLAPVPMRGKSNEPSYVRYTAQYLADLKGLSLADFAAQTTRNAETVFSRLKAA